MTRTVSSARIPISQSRTAINSVASLQPNDSSISANLGLWVKADTAVFKDISITPAINNDAVENWNDQSGNNANLQQTTSGNRPTFQTNIQNRLPALLFKNASNLFMTTANQSILSPSAALSIFAVVKPNQVNAVQGIISKDIDGGISNPPYSIQTTTPKAYSFGVNNTVPTSQGTNGGLPDSSNAQILEHIVIMGTSGFGYINGTQIISYVPTGTLYQSTGVFQVGRQKNTFTTRGFDGYIMEVLFYNSNLSTAQRQGIEAYLANKWGITTATNRGGTTQRSAVS